MAQQEGHSSQLGLASLEPALSHHRRSHSHRQAYLHIHHISCEIQLIGFTHAHRIVLSTPTRFLAIGESGLAHTSTCPTGLILFPLSICIF